MAAEEQLIRDQRHDYRAAFIAPVQYLLFRRLRRTLKLKPPALVACAGLAGNPTNRMLGIRRSGFEQGCADHLAGIGNADNNRARKELWLFAECRSQYHERVSLERFEEAAMVSFCGHIHRNIALITRLRCGLGRL